MDSQDSETDKVAQNGSEGLQEPDWDKISGMFAKQEEIKAKKKDLEIEKRNRAIKRIVQWDSTKPRHANGGKHRDKMKQYNLALPEKMYNETKDIAHYGMMSWAQWVRNCIKRGMRQYYKQEKRGDL